MDFVSSVESWASHLTIRIALGNDIRSESPGNVTLSDKLPLCAVLWWGEIQLYLLVSEYSYPRWSNCPPTEWRSTVAISWRYCKLLILESLCKEIWLARAYPCIIAVRQGIRNSISIFSGVMNNFLGHTDVRVSGWYCQDRNFRPLSQILVFESHLFFSNLFIDISIIRVSQ
jgi:hypothetical protein